MAKLALITGPESSATRLFTSILSQHPHVLGTPDAKEHDDILDEVWVKLEAGNIASALACLPDTEGYEILLTRRTIPHGQIGVDATSQDLPNFWGLHEMCRRANMELVVLITTRSTAANLASWTDARASPGGDLRLTQLMYQVAYRYLFEFLGDGVRKQVPFFLLSLEALLLDRQGYAQSILSLLGLPSFWLELSLYTEVNERRYEWYEENGRPMV